MTIRDEINTQLVFLQQQRTNLAHFLSQKNTFDSGHVPIHLINNITEARNNIARIKKILMNNYSYKVSNMPDDKEDHTAVTLQVPENYVILALPKVVADILAQQFDIESFIVKET